MAGSAHVPYGPGLTEIGPTDTTDEVVLEFWTKSARGVASHRSSEEVVVGGGGVEDSSGTNLSWLK